MKEHNPHLSSHVNKTFVTSEMIYISTSDNKHLTECCNS